MIHIIDQNIEKWGINWFISGSKCGSFGMAYRQLVVCVIKFDPHERRTLSRGDFGSNGALCLGITSPGSIYFSRIFHRLRYDPQMHCHQAIWRSFLQFADMWDNLHIVVEMCQNVRRCKQQHLALEMGQY